MSGDEADFRSNLKDLESFVELLSPIAAQSRETTVVDSARRIDFDAVSYTHLTLPTTSRV